MRVESLTFFRFLAALIVVSFHYGGVANLDGVFKAGHQMVTFFFVLSGFVMVQAYYSRPEVNAKKYWFARFARIMPVYFIAMVLSIVIIVSKDMPNLNVSATSVALHLSFLQAWIPPFPMAINSPAWSISVEAFFYLLFPFILIAIKKYKMSGNKLIGLAIALWLITQVVLFFMMRDGAYKVDNSVRAHLLFYFPALHLASFIFGVAGGVWFLERKNAGSVGSSTASLFAVVLFVAIVALLENLGAVSSMLNRGDVATFHFDGSLLAPIFLLFIVAVSMSSSWLSNILSWKPFVLLGEASYALYILHAPYALVWIAYLLPVLKLPFDIAFYSYTATLIPMSVLVFLYVERPVKRFLLNYKKQPLQPAATEAV